MNKSSILLVSVALLFAFLVHDTHAFHSPASENTGDPPTHLEDRSGHTRDGAPGSPHHALPDITPATCSIDLQLIPQVATGFAQDVVITPYPWHVTQLSWSTPPTHVEEPGYPAAVRRALLQVYLN
jgi:hypothetical protein